jgi:predicted SAM-dependent methyltransferase
MTLKQYFGKWLFAHLPFSRRTFDILRFELRVTRERWLNLLLPWRLAKVRRLLNMRDISLNVGSGGFGLNGWINLDATANHANTFCTHDLRCALPFSEGSVKRILAEHVIEHMDFKDDVPRIFREFHRVLQPGGVVRIIVPDAERFMSAYLNKGSEQWAALGFPTLPSDMNTPIELVNHVFHQGGEHCFGWDFTAMEFYLHRAGFAQIIRQTYGKSNDAELAIDQPNHEKYSLYVEASK